MKNGHLLRLHFHCVTLFPFILLSVYFSLPLSLSLFLVASILNHFISLSLFSTLSLSVYLYLSLP